MLINEVTPHQYCFVFIWHITVLNTFKTRLFYTTQAKRKKMYRRFLFSCLPSPDEGCFSGSHSHPQNVQVWLCDPDCWAHGLSKNHSVCSASCSAYPANSPDLPKTGRHKKTPHTWNHSLRTVNGASQDWHSCALLWGPVSSVPAVSWDNLILIRLTWVRENRSRIIVQLRKASVEVWK